MAKVKPRVADIAQLFKSASEERRKFWDIAGNQFPPDVVAIIERLTPLPDGDVARQLALDIRQSVFVGFLLAVIRYRKELRNNEQAMALLTSRKNGGELGRLSNSKRKASRKTLAQEMIAAGKEPKDIARELGVHVSTVYGYLEPAGSKPRASRKRSRGK
jgi:hypothetical protein